MVYADKIGGSVSQYRDSSGLEVDAIVHLRNGDWGAVEMKLGGNEIDDGLKNLLRLAQRVTPMR